MKALAAVLAAVSAPALAAPHFGCAVEIGRCQPTLGGQKVASCDVRTLNVAGRRFVKTTYHFIAPPPREGRADGEQYAQIIAIARPATPSDRAWNRVVRARVIADVAEEYGDDAQRTADEQRIDFQLDASIVAASPDLIDAAFGKSWYWASMAHPNGVSAGMAWSSKLGRALTARDLFGPGRRWNRALTKAAQARVQASVDGGPARSPITTIDTPDVWRFSARGLGLVYDPYVLGGYLSAAEAALPWRVVRPYLAPRQVFDPRALVTVGDDATC